MAHGRARGTAADVEIEAREILKMRERLNKVFAERTGQPLERIQEDTRRNFWLSAKEAQDYGLVGTIVATLIVQEGLEQRAGCDLSLLTEPQQDLPVAQRTQMMLLTATSLPLLVALSGRFLAFLGARDDEHVFFHLHIDVVHGDAPQLDGDLVLPVHLHRARLEGDDDHDSVRAL